MLAAGIAGGYTTWSTWAWESLALGEDGSLVELTAHIAGSRVVAWPRPTPPAVPPEVIVVRLVSATRRTTVLYAHHDRDSAASMVIVVRLGSATRRPTVH